MKFNYLPTILLACICLGAGASEIRRFSFGDWGKQIGYSEAVAVGDTVYLSGIIGEGDTMKEALLVAIGRIDDRLRRLGLDKSLILKEKIYTNDKDALREVTQVRKDYYSPDFPAAVWIEVEEQSKTGGWLEIELVIHLPEGFEFPEK